MKFADTNDKIIQHTVLEKIVYSKNPKPLTQLRKSGLNRINFQDLSVSLFYVPPKQVTWLRF